MKYICEDVCMYKCVLYMCEGLCVKVCRYVSVCGGLRRCMELLFDECQDVKDQVSDSTYMCVWVCVCDGVGM